MSAKNLDSKGRWRSVGVSFRVSPEESEMLDKIVALTGQSKQEYLINRALNKDIVVVPNPRVYKALQEQLKCIYNEMVRMDDEDGLSEEFLDILHLLVKICIGMRGENN